MSLDVDLMVVKPTSVFEYNITHNLNTMAMAVEFEDGHTLYHALWRPDEHGWTKARDIEPYLYLGMKELTTNPKKYLKHNPENGWGSYEGLVEFVKKYHAACLENMDAELRISR
jgi:hypothetical protein